MLCLVSLQPHKSLSRLGFRISKVWVRHTFAQLASISSEHIAQISFFYWLDKKERPSEEVWNELDEILSSEIFKSLLIARISCRHRDGDYKWCKIDDFDYSKLPGFFPNKLWLLPFLSETDMIWIVDWTLGSLVQQPPVSLSPLAC